MERFEEEVKLTEAESSRVGRTFEYFARKWNERARVAKREERNSEEHTFGMVQLVQHSVGREFFSDLPIWHMLRMRNC